MSKIKLKIKTTLENDALWPEYLRNEADYYNRPKLVRDLLGAADIIEALKAERDLHEANATQKTMMLAESGKQVISLKAENEKLRNGIEATLRALNGGMSKSAIASILDRILGDSHE